MDKETEKYTHKPAHTYTYRNGYMERWRVEIERYRNGEAETERHRNR